MTVSQTYCPENHNTLQARSEDHEDRWWTVAYHPDKDYRKFGQGDGRHAHVDSFDNVPLKIGE
jgi:hypothetical protein